MSMVGGRWSMVHGRGSRWAGLVADPPFFLEGLKSLEGKMRTRIVAGVLVVAAAVLQAQSGSTVTPDDYKRWRTELRNWGRWGPNDQKGTANLITPQKVQEAARLVR